MGAGKKVYICVSFSPQSNSNFMVLKILQIHYNCRISQGQSSSTITFQTFIWNEGVGYRWKENGHFR